MTEQKNTLHTKGELCKILNNIIDKEFSNVTLRRALTNEFSKKGLPMGKINSLFNKVLNVEDISNIEILLFAMVCYDILKINKLNNEELEQFFSKKDIDACRKMKRIEEKKIDSIELENMYKIDDANFVGRISHEQIHQYMNNVLLYYNTKSQREPNLKKIGTKGEYIREMDLNNKHVDEIATLMFNHEYEENQIILNIRLTDGAVPDMQFIGRDSNDDVIGTLKITPHTEDENAENYTIVDILDGMHRIKGSLKGTAMQLSENGEYLKGGLDVRVVVRTLEDARKIVRQTFKRSDTGAEYLKSMDTNNYTITVDNIIKNSTVLKKNVADSYVDYIAENAITYKTILTTALEKYSELDVESITVRQLGAKKIAKTIDIIVLSLQEMYFNNSSEEMKNNSVFMNAHMFIGYLLVGCILYKEKADNIDIFTIIEKIYNIPDSSIKNMELNNKHCNMKEIYNVFSAIVDEVK